MRALKAFCTGIAVCVAVVLSLSLVPTLQAQDEGTGEGTGVGIGVGSGAGSSSGSGSEMDAPGPSRAAVPDFALNNLDGEQVRLSDYAGQVVIVNFWATWCVPCLQELQFLQEYYTEFEDQGLVLLAISRDGPETFSQVRRVARRYRWTMSVLLDQTGTAAALLNPRDATPYTMFIDRSGRLAYEHEGYTPGVELTYRDHIIDLLAQPAP